MLVPDNAIIVDNLYLGTGIGCRQVVRCELIRFTRKLDCGENPNAMRDALREIQNIAFQMFRDGNYTIQPDQRHGLASSIVQQSDYCLIDKMFDDDSFVRDITVRELSRRNLIDQEIYRLGKFGNELARSVAIESLKSRLNPSLSATDSDEATT